MKVQECIALLVRHHGWIFKMQAHPIAGLRERRYKFTIPRTLGFTAITSESCAVDTPSGLVTLNKRPLVLCRC